MRLYYVITSAYFTLFTLKCYLYVWSCITTNINTGVCYITFTSCPYQWSGYIVFRKVILHAALMLINCHCHTHKRNSTQYSVCSVQWLAHESIWSCSNSGSLNTTIILKTYSWSQQKRWNQKKNSILEVSKISILEVSKTSYPIACFLFL